MFEYKTGHIGRFWSEENYVNLDYTKKPLKPSQIDEWRAQGYDGVKSFNGSLYDSSNPMPEWIDKFDNLFPDIRHKTFTFYKMETMEIMPTHADHYEYYMKSHDVKDKTKISRTIIMLEDWKPGHYLEINGRGFTGWVAGDWFQWYGICPHAAGNLGRQPRYTLQITGQRFSENILKDLHWVNIPDLPSKDETLQHPSIRYALNEKIPDSDTDPIFIYMHNGKISQLDKIKHSKPTIKYLNTIGLKFYLYEPLCSYATNFAYNKINQNHHNAGFYSEFLKTESYASNQMMRADELDSIYRYAWNNTLTNITVYTGDYNVEKYYNYYSPRLKLECNDLFLLMQQKIQGLETEPLLDFKKKFINLNWRYTKHRHLIAAFLASSNSHVSFYFRGDLGNVSTASWVRYGKWLEEQPHLFDRLLHGIVLINQGLPLKVDIETKLSSTSVLDTNSCMWPEGVKYSKGQTPAEDNTKTNSLQPYYQDVFCDVVTETRFAQPTGNYSEKLYQAIQYKKPFILAAPPKTLEYARTQGFETFGDFWDESYDDCLDHSERLMKIFQVIDFIDNKSLSELRSMYLEMLPIIEHNFTVLQKLLRRES